MSFNRAPREAMLHRRASYEPTLTNHFKLLDDPFRF
jgi:hypothetical protein